MSNPDRPKCPHCGTTNDVDAVYCGACGRELTGSQEPQGGRSRSEITTKPKDPALLGTMLGVPSQAAATVLAEKTPEETPAEEVEGGSDASGGAQRANKTTTPGYSDPAEGRSPSPPEPPRPSGLKGRAALGGPTLLEEPSFPKDDIKANGKQKDVGEVSPQQLQASPPSAHSTAVNPTLMSESPLRAVTPLKKSPSTPEDGALTQRTLLDQPVFGDLEKPTEKASEAAPKTDKAELPPTKDAQVTKRSGRPIELGGPTLLDQLVFSDAELKGAAGAGAPESRSGEAPPPLSNEALALLERFSGSMGGSGKELSPSPEGEDKAQHKADGEPESAEHDKANTLWGVPSLEIDATAETPSQDQGDASGEPLSERDSNPMASTILGLPVPDAVREAGTDQDEDTLRHEISFEDSEEPEEEHKPQGDAGATMLGIPLQTIKAAASASIEKKPPVDQGAPGGTASAGPGSAEAPSDEGGMTMLGLPSPARRASEDPPDGEAQPPVGLESTPEAFVEDEVEMPGHGRGWLILIIVLVAVVVGGVGVAAVKLVFFGDGQDITSEVTVGGDRIRVTLVVDQAAKGGRVRFAGQEQPLTEGRATFEIQSDLLVVGQNELPVEIEDPEGGTSTASVNFDVSYKAVADLGGLKARPPHYTVEFRVMKGAALKVASEAVELDDQGRYLHKIQLDEALAGAMDAGEAISHSVPFSVQLPGQEPLRASIDTAVPRTTLRVQSPTDGMVVDRDSIQCTGLTESGAEVTINGTKVPSPEGRFSHSVPLPTLGEFPIEVAATVQGKAPRTLRFKVSRAESLAPAIQEFAASIDGSLDFERVNRDPEAVRGRPVRFHGRVVAVESSSGQTLMQVLVDEGCAQEGRCSIHVTYRGEAEISLFAWVTIYGTVSGRWEGQTQGGNRLIMPAIVARFVVPDQGRR